MYGSKSLDQKHVIIGLKPSYLLKKSDNILIRKNEKKLVND
jgi:hypothetical protein